MAQNNATNFTTIAADSGSATMATGTNTGFTIAGAGGASTSASGSTITVTASASPPAPNSIINLFDDFIGVDASIANVTDLISNYNWFNTDGSGGKCYQALVTSSNGHPGLLSNYSNVSPGFQVLYLTNDNPTGPAQVHNFVLGGGVIQINWVINTAILSNGTNRYILRLGMGDTQGTSADVANGVYFEYSDNINAGNWVIKTANASTRTTTNTSTAVGTGFVNLGITINAAGTSIAYTVNGSAVSGSPIATNIPTAAISPFIKLTPIAGTIAASSLVIDLFYLTQTLTTPR